MNDAAVKKIYAEHFGDSALVKPTALSVPDGRSPPG